MALLYVAAARLAAEFTHLGQDLPLVWLPSGVAVATLVRWGAPMAVPLVGVVLGVQLWIGQPAWAAVAFAVASGLGCGLAGGFLARTRFDPDLVDTREITKLAFAAFVCLSPLPAIGTATLMATGAIASDAASGSAFGAYLRNALGVFLGTPMALALHRAWVSRTLFEPVRLRTALRTVPPVAMLVIGGLLLALASHAPSAPPALLAMFALQLAVAIAAVRFGPLGIWSTLLAVGVAVAVPTVRGVGPFVGAAAGRNEWIGLLFVLLATAFAVLVYGARRRLGAAQRALATRERQLSAVFEQSNAALSVAERGRFLMVNDAFCAMVGYPREALVGLHHRDVTHPDDRHRHAAALRRCLDEGRGGVLFEQRYLHRDGEVVWGRVAITVVRIEGGDVPQIVAVTLDVTGHKRIEASLRRQREQLALVFAATGSGLWDHDLLRGHVFFSDSYVQMLGHPPGTSLARLATQTERLHPDDRARFIEHETALLERRVPFDVDYRLRRADGGFLWVHGIGYAVWDDSGRAVRSYGTIADISMRKAAESALVESRARLSTVIDSALDGIVAVDDLGRVLLFNPAAERLFGRAAVDVIGRSMLMLMPPRLRGNGVARLLAFASGVRRIEGGPPGRTTLAVLHADGREFQVDVSVAMVTVDARRLVTMVVRDARERERLDEAERARERAEAASRSQSEVLSRMGQELRTPLDAMLGIAQRMEIDGEVPLPPVHRERARAIREAGIHLGALIDDLLDLTRIETDRIRLERVDIDVGAIGRQCLRLVSLAAADAGVTLHQDDDGDRGRVVLGDPTRLRQVLVNLLSNAIGYNRRGGSVRLASGDADDGTAWLDVVDDGPGIRPEDQDRLFEPFDRLGREHGPVRGAGLGLPLARGLVEAMGGRLEVDSAPGRGSTFRVRLACARRAASATANAMPDRPASADAPRVPDRA